MAFLIGHIVDDGVGIRLADGERSVTGLPMETGECRAFGFQPFRRTGFHRLDDLGDGARSRNAEEKMHMIGDATNAQRRAVDIVERAREVGMQFRADFRRDHRFTVSRTEDQVDQDAGKGLGHGSVGYDLSGTNGA